MNTSTYHIDSEIALWGPTGSGKTWLMHSLGRALFNLNDPEFTYSLSEFTGIDARPLSAHTPPEVRGTERPRDERWLFQRIPPESRKNSKKHAISAHSHIINMHDLKGEETLKLQEAITTATIKDSQYILLMLDHTLLMSAQSSALASIVPGDQDADQYQPLSQNDYVQHVQNLFYELEKDTLINGRKVAVCLTKIDLLGVQKRDPWQLIDVFFGKHMRQLLEQYRNKWIMQAFGVSAAGYLRSEGSNKPNYDPNTQGLRQPDQWSPYNVQAPFFWLFEQVERYRLKQTNNLLKGMLFSNEKDYIKYPISLS